MNAKEFNSLDSFRQIEIILKGRFLADRLNDTHYIKLYSVENFFVEVYFEDSTHLIDQLIAFHQIFYTLPFLENLEIAV